MTWQLLSQKSMIAAIMWKKIGRVEKYWRWTCGVCCYMKQLLLSWLRGLNKTCPKNVILLRSEHCVFTKVAIISIVCFFTIMWIQKQVKGIYQLKKNAWYQCYFNIVGEILACFVRYEKQTQKYIFENFFFQIYISLLKDISISTLEIPKEPSVIRL